MRAVTTLCAGFGTLLFVLLAASSAGTAPQQGRLVWLIGESGYDPAEWHTINADGSGHRRLPGARDVMTFALSPDGRSLASSHIPGGLRISTVEGSGGRRLALTGTPQALDWSPDSRKLAFVDRRGVWTLTVRDSRARLIVPLAGVTGLAWSPCGRQLAFVRGADGAGVLTWKNVIYVVGADGSAPRRVAVVYGYGADTPSWSADCRRIAYSSKRRRANANGAIFSLDIRTGVRTSLGVGSSPAYSPDGSKLAFFLYTHGRPWVAVSRADGSHRQLVAQRWYEQWIWSPDSQWLAGADYRRDGLVVMRPDGTQARKLAPIFGEVVGLDWA